MAKVSYLPVLEGICTHFIAGCHHPGVDRRVLLNKFRIFTWSSLKVERPGLG